MARHCRDAHGMQAFFLKEKRKPKWTPYKEDWQDEIHNPKPILVRVIEDSDDSDSEGNINVDNVINVDNEGLGSLD